MKCTFWRRCRLWCRVRCEVHSNANPTVQVQQPYKTGFTHSLSWFRPNFPLSTPNFFLHYCLFCNAHSSICRLALRVEKRLQCHWCFIPAQSLKPFGLVDIYLFSNKGIVLPAAVQKKAAFPFQLRLKNYTIRHTNFKRSFWTQPCTEPLGFTQ